MELGVLSTDCPGDFCCGPRTLLRSQETFSPRQPNTDADRVQRRDHLRRNSHDLEPLRALPPQHDPVLPPPIPLQVLRDPALDDSDDHGGEGPEAEAPKPLARAVPVDGRHAPGHALGQR